jgi:hypothetical protein
MEMEKKGIGWGLLRLVRGCAAAMILVGAFMAVSGLSDQDPEKPGLWVGCVAIVFGILGVVVLDRWLRPSKQQDTGTQPGR